MNFKKFRYVNLFSAGSILLFAICAFVYQAEGSEATNPVAHVQLQQLPVPTFLKAGANSIYHYSAQEVKGICERVIPVLANDAIYLQLNDGNKYIVIGDLHGDIVCLEAYLQRYLPEVERGEAKILFLGDLIERAPNSIEVLTRILQLKIAHPDSIYILKGNHEIDKAEIGGDLRLKYGETEKEQVFDALGDVFANFPVAASVYNKYLCVHGGIPDGFNAEQLRACNITPNQLATLPYGQQDNIALIQDFDWFKKLSFVRFNEMHDLGNKLVALFGQPAEGEQQYLIRGHDHWAGLRPLGESAPMYNIISSMALSNITTERDIKKYMRDQGLSQEDQTAILNFMIRSTTEIPNLQNIIDRFIDNCPENERNKVRNYIYKNGNFGVLILSRGRDPEFKPLRELLANDEFRSSVRKTLLADFGREFFYDCREDEAIHHYEDNPVFTDIMRRGVDGRKIVIDNDLLNHEYQAALQEERIQQERHPRESWRHTARVAAIQQPLPGNWNEVTAGIPLPPPLAVSSTIPVAPPLGGNGVVPPAPPIGGVPAAPALPGASSSGIPAAPPLAVSSTIPVAPPLGGNGVVPPAPPIGGVPAALALPGASSSGIPAAPPLAVSSTIPAAPPLGGNGVVPPAPPIGGVPAAPALQGNSGRGIPAAQSLISDGSIPAAPPFAGDSAAPTVLMSPSPVANRFRPPKTIGENIRGRVDRYQCTTTTPMATQRQQSALKGNVAALRARFEGN